MCVIICGQNGFVKNSLKGKDEVKLYNNLKIPKSTIRKKNSIVHTSGDLIGLIGLGGGDTAGVNGLT